jgi:DNA processing protein
MNTDRKNWLVAIRATGLSGRRLIEAAEAAGGINELVAAKRSRLQSLGLGTDTIADLKSPDEALIEADLRWLDGDEHHLLAWDDENYPPLLRSISSPPAALFVDGNPNVLWQPQIAVIGSRNPTAGGLDHARAFSNELCRAGMTVTSGLASGIDSAAHGAALDSGSDTVAVCGTGPDTVYPASSRRLAERIRGQGALVTELPTGNPPKRGHFPSRNRIISGLSLGVLVIEAGLNSGTLITARQAGEQGREVFALPGSLHNPMAKGCHRLIREGARLVETVQDVLSELGPLANELASALRAELDESRPGPGSPPNPSRDAGGLLEDPEYRRLWEALAYDPRTVGELVQATGFPVQSVSSMLLMLDLQGKVQAHSSGRYSRAGGWT